MWQSSLLVSSARAPIRSAFAETNSAEDPFYRSLHLVMAAFLSPSAALAPQGSLPRTRSTARCVAPAARRLCRARGPNGDLLQADSLPGARPPFGSGLVWM